MWKTTDRFVAQKRAKAQEAETKLKQVYIPNYNKPNPNLVGPANTNGQPALGERPCDSCDVSDSSF
jgi:metastasis-associated protein MTA